MPFEYQEEKLQDARRALMIPHSQGVDASVRNALEVFDRGMFRLDESLLDDNARRWVRQVREFQATAQGRSLNTDEQLELSKAVDELANWFGRARG